MNRLIRQKTMLSTLAATCASQAILVVSGIGATRILGVQDRGRLALFNLLPTLLVLLGTCGLPIAATYFIARRPLRARATVMPILRLLAILTVLLTAVDAGVLATLERNAPTKVLVAAAVSLPLVASNVAQLLGQAVLQGLQRYRAFNFWRVLPSLTYAVAVAILYVTPLGNLLTLTVAFVATSVGVATATIFAALRAIPPTAADGPPTASLKEVLRFGLTAVLGAVYPTETFQLDQAAVGLFLPSTSLGLYVVAVSFTNLPRFIAQSFGVLAFPRAAAATAPAIARRVVLRYTLAAALACVLVCVGLELAVGFLAPFLYGHAFTAAVPVTRILLISSFIVSTRRVLADGLRGAGYPGIGSLGETVAMLLLIPLLAILISSDGLHGAAIAVTTSSLAGFTVILARAVAALRQMRHGRIRTKAPDVLLSVRLPVDRPLD